MNGAIQTVPFHDMSLSAVLINGAPFVAMRPICESLGLSWSSQRKRIHRDPELKEAVAIMTTPSAGGIQKTLFLSLDKLNGWLFGVDVARVREELRERMNWYRRECYAVLARHFGLSRPEAEQGVLQLVPPEQTVEGSERTAHADSPAITIIGISVRQDGHGRYSLNDLHKVAMADGCATEAHRPSSFLRAAETQAFVAALDRGARGEPQAICAVHTQQGRAGGSYGSRLVALRYAAWIDLRFGAQVHKLFGDMDAAMAHEAVMQASPAPEGTTQYIATLSKVFGSGQATMSSVEIRDLTGKRHDYIMRDIRLMLIELYGPLAPSRFEDTHYYPENSQVHKIYRLPQRECMILFAGYDTKARAEIVDRWMGRGQSAVNPPSPAPAAPPSVALPPAARPSKGFNHGEAINLSLGYLRDAVTLLSAATRPDMPAGITHDLAAMAHSAVISGADEIERLAANQTRS